MQKWRQIRHGSNQGNTSAGQNPVGNALRGVPARAERHGGRSLQCYPDGRQIEPCQFRSLELRFVWILVLRIWEYANMANIVSSL
jgi:hypothetical protein